MINVNFRLKNTSVNTALHTHLLNGKKSIKWQFDYRLNTVMTSLNNFKTIKNKRSVYYNIKTHQLYIVYNL